MGRIGRKDEGEAALPFRSRDGKEAPPFVCVKGEKWSEERKKESFI